MLIYFIFGGVALLLAVIQAYILYRLANMPLLDDLDEDIERLCNDIDKIENDLQVYIADIYDKVEGVLKPINKRLATRAIREEEKDINTEETFKKTGLMSGNDLKRYGINNKS